MYILSFLFGIRMRTRYGSPFADTRAGLSAARMSVGGARTYELGVRHRPTFKSNSQERTTHTVSEVLLLSVPFKGKLNLLVSNLEGHFIWIYQGV